ncbi:taurine ABC transporter substrate-binding protein [Luteococcus sp. Sow4_B9]|uniref:taurine ABC transporter substrate-binding protein n=1 Tax=Luteococcus sp. Sow4_B9 TaxID=3438792 RepID=UPI003F9E5F0B
MTTKVRIAWQPVPNGDLVVKDRRWLEACMPNATIEWMKMSSGADVVQAFGANAIDMGQIGSSPMVKSVSGPLDLDIQTVWIHDIIGKAESLVVRDSGVTGLDGLKGKRVAAAFGSTAHYSLIRALSAQGLLNSVTLVNLAPDAMLGAWNSGEIDAAWVWDPVLSQLAAKGRVVLSSADTASQGSPTFDLEAATAEFSAANPAFMTVWTQLQDRAVTMIRDRPDQAAASIGSALGVPAEEAQTLLPGYEYPTAHEQNTKKYFGGGMVRLCTSTGGFLRDQGSVTVPASADRCVRAFSPSKKEGGR